MKPFAQRVEELTAMLGSSTFTRIPSGVIVPESLDQREEAVLLRRALDCTHFLS
jgi:hypothetical protein